MTTATCVATALAVLVLLAWDPLAEDLDDIVVPADQRAEDPTEGVYDLINPDDGSATGYMPLMVDEHGVIVSVGWLPPQIDPSLNGGWIKGGTGYFYADIEQEFGTDYRISMRFYREDGDLYLHYMTSPPPEWSTWRLVRR